MEDWRDESCCFWNTLCTSCPPSTIVLQRKPRERKLILFSPGTGTRLIIYLEQSLAHYFLNCRVLGLALVLLLAMDLVELRDLVISLEVLDVGLEGLKLVLEVLGLLKVGELLPLKERLHLISSHEFVTKHVP